MTNAKRKRSLKYIHRTIAGLVTLGLTATATPWAMAPAWSAEPARPATAEVTIERPADGAATILRHLTISGRASDGAALTLTINGVLVGEGISGLRERGVYEFVNVPVEPGPQQITVTSRDADGQEQSTKVAIHVQGAPEALTVEGPENAPADARTLSVYTIIVSDAWGKPAADGAFVTVAADAGTLQTPDADQNTAGVQVRVEGGTANVAVRSPNKPGPGAVRATAGVLTAAQPIRFAQPTRPFVLVGQLSGATGGARGLSQSFSSPYLGGLDDSRLSFFTRGSLPSGYLVTAAFDSRRSLYDRLFKELDPQSTYPVFGDTSSVFYEAQSRDRLYLQVEKDGDLYRYGDFNAILGGSVLGAYRRTLTGMHLQHKTNLGPLTFFGSRTSQSVERAEVRGNGTSGFYFLPMAPVVAGSERIHLEVRDRDRPQIVLRSEPKMRFVDYDIDYAQGSIFFKQPVPGIDADQNPVYIVSVYESDAPGTRRLVTGLRADTEVGGVALGSTLVREDRGAADYTLGSIDAMMKLPGNTMLSTEYAATNGEASGSAWRVDAQSAPNDRLRLRGYLRGTSRNFDNPSTPLYEVGTTRHGLDVNYQLSPRESAAFEYYRQNGDLYSLTTANTRYRRQFSRANTEFELLHQAYGGSYAVSTGNSTLLSGKMLYPVRPGLDLVLQREQELGGDNPLRPSGTTLGLDYQVMPGVTLLGREKLTDSGRSIASFGVSLSPQFLKKGASLTASYEMNSVNTGGHNQASIGLNTTLTLARYVTSHLAYERVRADGGGASYGSASIGLEYRPIELPFITSLKLERRATGGTAQHSLTVGASGRVLDDVAVLLRHTYFDDGGANNALIGYNGEPLGRTTFGLAYRPNDDRLNILARYQKRGDTVASTTGFGVLQGWSHLGAIETILQAGADTQIGLKYAFRKAFVSTEGVTSSAFTDVWLGRVTRELGPRWNFSSEVRLLRQRETDTSQVGYGLEIGYLPRRDLIVGLGYNLAGQDDQDLSGGRRWAQGPYMRFGLKFDEETLGGLR